MIKEVRPHLYWIDLDQGMPGFEKFIGSWVLDGKRKVIVDVGPRASFPQLMDALGSLKIETLDFIFLTHIHIDHAGATGLVLERFPKAKVVCHPAGVNHLIHPEKLWEGSKKVLGELALKYGEIAPVPEENLIPSDGFTLEGFHIIKTPGHAAHHMSIQHGDTLFAGEAGGIFLNINNPIYLRPATPPRFILEEAAGSVDQLLRVEARDICYAHAGIHPEAKRMLARYKDQLFLWRDVAEEQVKKSKPENVLDRCFAALLEKDELLRGFAHLGDGEKERERYFIRNSLQGFLGYLGQS
jgi:glyoxylase-like metal-dependent hydrolase (beta-lactamase superfamily II)